MSTTVGLSLRQFYRNEYQNSFISSLRNVNDAWKGEGKEESALVRGGEHEEEDSVEENVEGGDWC